MAIAPNRVAGTWFGVWHQAIGTILIVVRQWPLYETGWLGHGLLVRTRVVGTWFAVLRREIDTVLIRVR